MMGTSHILVAGGGWGVALAALHSRGSLSTTELVYSVPIALAMGLGPDIDIRMGSIVQDLLGGHRGWTHTLIGWALVTGFCFAVFDAVVKAAPADVALGRPWVFTMAASWGWLCHMIADTCTVGGVPWLKPFTGRRYTFGLFKTGSVWEYLLVAAFLVLCGVTAGKLTSAGSHIDNIRHSVIESET